MTGPFKKLQNVYLVAEDTAALAGFYEQVLGVAPKFRDGDKWVQYDGFALASRAEAAPATQGAVPVFEVDSFEGMASRITAAGGEVLGTRDMGSHGQVMSLRDAQGHVVQLFMRAPR